MEWWRFILFQFKYLYGKFMNKSALPTVNDDGEFIDPQRVLCVYIFIENGQKFIHCFVDGVLYFLVWTIELERWFMSSGFSLPNFDHVPNGGKITHVNNIPEKYKKVPKP